MDPKANYKEETERNFLLMSIAYAANIGGKMFFRSSHTHKNNDV